MAALAISALRVCPAPRRGRARFSTREGNDATVVSAFGELDASNMQDLTEHARCGLRFDRALVLDLSELSFFGGGGVAALMAISEECAAAVLPWAVVPNRPISRLLAIGDPDSLVPTAKSVTEALHTFTSLKTARPALELVPEQQHE